MKKLILSIAMFFCLFQTCLADSPLTTTEFAQVYKEIPIIQQALKSEDKALTPAMLKYIADKKNPVDVKLSIINALGFTNGKNAERLQRYLETKYLNMGKDFYASANASEMITLAYAYSLDNYVDLDKAFVFAHYARIKSPQSLSVRLMIGLMEAQLALDVNWGMVYQAVNEVITDKTLVQDFNPLCVKGIMEYMNEYKAYK